MNARGEFVFTDVCSKNPCQWFRICVVKTALAVPAAEPVKNQEHLKSTCLLSDFLGFRSNCFLFAPCDCCCGMVAVAERKETRRAAERLLMQWLFLVRCGGTKLNALEAGSSEQDGWRRVCSRQPQQEGELSKIPCEAKCWRSISRSPLQSVKAPRLCSSFIILGVLAAIGSRTVVACKCAHLHCGCLMTACFCFNFSKLVWIVNSSKRHTDGVLLVAIRFLPKKILIFPHHIFTIIVFYAAVSQCS